MSYEGFVDLVSSSEIQGWAYDSFAPTAALDVEVLVEDQVIATVEANHFRTDLVAAGKGNGAHAFKYALKAMRPGVLPKARIKGTQQLLSESVPQPEGPRPNDVREAIAHRHLTGRGIEIGALHYPLAVPPSATVRYVDRMPVDQLRQQYPELADKPLVDVDLVMDGETLSGIPDGSENFVIANNFIEHTQDPIRTIQHFLRVLRPGGVLYMAVPHKHHTFDRDRPSTPLEHVVRDYREGPAWSRRSHFEEWSRLVGKTPEAEVAANVEQLMRMDYSIHYHVWTEIDFLEMLVYCHKTLGMPFSIELCQRLGHEIIMILTKNWVEPAGS